MSNSEVSTNCKVFGFESDENSDIIRVIRSQTRRYLSNFRIKESETIQWN